MSNRDPASDSAPNCAACEELAAERDEALQAMDRLVSRVERVEAARDQMFEDGHAAALAVSRIRRLIEWAETDPDRPYSYGGTQAPHMVDPDRLRAALDGGEPQ